jgi:hypothetical protein
MVLGQKKKDDVIEHSKKCDCGEARSIICKLHGDK